MRVIHYSYDYTCVMMTPTSLCGRQYSQCDQVNLITIIELVLVKTILFRDADKHLADEVLILPDYTCVLVSTRVDN